MSLIDNVNQCEVVYVERSLAFFSSDDQTQILNTIRISSNSVIYLIMSTDQYVGQDKQDPVYQNLPHNHMPQNYSLNIPKIHYSASAVKKMG